MFEHLDGAGERLMMGPGQWRCDFLCRKCH
jgi:hypothetical protein